ncbi:hypothetical protein ACH4F6_22400 [Streptomyces sp. NPDC017936]|uniref:hypothetical protein n=1 Tax=Streptomyces sp. NPDC017936 TaxID=3365016 RepID=UPI00378C7426
MNHVPSAEADPTTGTTEEALDRAQAARAAVAGGSGVSVSEARPTSGLNAEAQSNGTKPAVRKQAPSV